MTALAPDEVVIVVGDLANGFRFIGPFEGHEAAHEWAEANRDVRSEGWVAITLEAVF